MKAFKSRPLEIVVLTLLATALASCGGANEKRYTLAQTTSTNDDNNNDDDLDTDDDFVDPLDAFNTYQGSPSPSPSSSPSVSVTVSPSPTVSASPDLDDEVEPDEEVNSHPTPSPSVSTSPLPQPRSTPLSIAVIGDGNTVGLHASHTRGSLLSPRQINNLNDSANGYRHRDFDELKHNLNLTLGFATGLDKSLSSVAKRLRDKKSSLKIFNAGSAVDGIDAMLSDQLEQVQSWSEGTFNESAPDVVVISAGLSDLCADSQADMTPSADFGEKMHELLVRILDANSRTRILLVAVAPYHTLYDQVQSRTAYRNYLGIGTSCKKFWDKQNICPSLTKSGSKTTVKNRVNEYNHYLETSTAALNAYFGPRIKFVSSNANSSINPDDVSMDCLHLSHEGQDRLAKRVWSYGWW